MTNEEGMDRHRDTVRNLSTNLSAEELELTRRDWLERILVRHMSRALENIYPRDASRLRTLPSMRETDAIEQLEAAAKVVVDTCREDLFGPRGDTPNAHHERWRDQSQVEYAIEQLGMIAQTWWKIQPEESLVEIVDLVGLLGESGAVDVDSELVWQLADLKRRTEQQDA